MRINSAYGLKLEFGMDEATENTKYEEFRSKIGLIHDE